MYYIRNQNGRSSLVIYNLAINVKLGFNFRLQKDDDSLSKKFSKTDFQRAFCQLMEHESEQGSGFDHIQKSLQGQKAFATRLEAEQHLIFIQCVSQMTAFFCSS